MKNKIIIVTGGASGIGLATAKNYQLIIKLLLLIIKILIKILLKKISQI